MSYRDYAYVEYVRAIDENPGEQYGIIIGFTGEDLKNLVLLTKDQITKHPSAANEQTAIPAQIVKETVVGARNMDDEKIQGVMADTAHLASVFATLGYAATQGRKIEFAFAEQLSPTQVNNDTVQMGSAKREGFSQFEDNPLEGARAFFQGAYENLGRPQLAVMYAFVKPLALH